MVFYIVSKVTIKKKGFIPKKEVILRQPLEFWTAQGWGTVLTDVPLFVSKQNYPL